MKIGKVTGSIVSTQKDTSLVGKKLMTVELVNTDKAPQNIEVVAVDSVGSGEGEYVLLSFGSVAQKLFNDPQSIIDCTIVGIIDSFE